MKKIIAACGNDCAACPRYVAHPYEKTDEELRHTAELWMKIGQIASQLSYQRFIARGYFSSHFSVALSRAFRPSSSVEAL